MLRATASRPTPITLMSMQVADHSDPGLSCSERILQVNGAASPGSRVSTPSGQRHAALQSALALHLNCCSYLYRERQALQSPRTAKTRPRSSTVQPVRVVVVITSTNNAGATFY